MKDVIHRDMFIMVGSFIVKERGVMNMCSLLTRLTLLDVGVLVSGHD